MAWRIIFIALLLYFALRMSRSACMLLRLQKYVSWSKKEPIPASKRQAYFISALLIPMSLFLYWLAARSFLGVWLPPWHGYGPTRTTAWRL